MKRKLGIRIFASIEIFIGSITLIAATLSLIQGKSSKPPEVLIFVLSASILSVILGIGILRHNLTCYHLLLYFSSIIILSKILVFGRIITLSGALETAVPSSLKNMISILYHSLVIFYFTRPNVQKEFGERRNVIFSLEKPFKNRHG